MSVLSGMVYCADCRKKLYQVRKMRSKEKSWYMVCANYRKLSANKRCTCHSIRNVVLEKLILSNLRNVLAFVRDDEDKFIELVTNQSKQELDKRLKTCKKELDTANARITRLEMLIEKLYEDNVDGKVSDERYKLMSTKYETEQSELKIKAKEFEDTIEKESASSINAKTFISQIKKIQNLKSLTVKS